MHVYCSVPLNGHTDMQVDITYFYFSVQVFKIIYFTFLWFNYLLAFYQLTVRVGCRDEARTQLCRRIGFINNKIKQSKPKLPHREKPNGTWGLINKMCIRTDLILECAYAKIHSNVHIYKNSFWHGKVLTATSGFWAGVRTFPCGKVVVLQLFEHLSCNNNKSGVHGSIKFVINNKDAV